MGTIICHLVGLAFEHHTTCSPRIQLDICPFGLCFCLVLPLGIEPRHALPDPALHGRQSPSLEMHENRQAERKWRKSESAAIRVRRGTATAPTHSPSCSPPALFEANLPQRGHAQSNRVQAQLEASCGGNEGDPETGEHASQAESVGCALARTEGKTQCLPGARHRSRTEQALEDANPSLYRILGKLQRVLERTYPCIGDGQGDKSGATNTTFEPLDQCRSRAIQRKLSLYPDNARLNSLLLESLESRQHHRPAVTPYQRKRTRRALTHASQEIPHATRLERMKRRAHGARVARRCELHEREEGSVLGVDDVRGEEGLRFGEGRGEG